MKRFNITTQTTYIKNGEEKKSYPQVGKLTYFSANGNKKEGYIMELYMYPNTKFFVFEDTPKTVQQGQNIQQAERALNGDDTNQELSGIPF